MAKRKTVIFDLDSTLVHCIFLDKEKTNIYNELRNHSEFDKIKDFIEVHELVDCNNKKIKGVGSITKVLVVKRPNSFEFIEYLSSFANIDIWSAGYKRYVKMLNYVVFPERKGIKTRNVFSKEDCYISGKTVLKNIKDKGYDLQTSIIIDDRADVCENNQNNAIQIPSFEPKLEADDIVNTIKNDNCLGKIMEWMENNDFKNSEDVRNLDKNVVFD